MLNQKFLFAALLSAADASFNTKCFSYTLPYGNTQGKGTYKSDLTILSNPKYTIIPASMVGSIKMCEDMTGNLTGL